MTWYYSDKGERRGPVPEEELGALLASGVLDAQSLVWKQGMAEWQPLSKAVPQLAAQRAAAPPPVAAAAAPAPGQVVCAECGKSFPESETLAFGFVRVCATCKPLYVQRLREGSLSGSSAAGVLRPAGFWIRVGAKILDGLIMAVPMMILFVPLAVLFGTGAAGANRNPGQAFLAGQGFLALQLGFQALALGASVLYNWYFLTRKGATPGKSICGLRVVGADGGKISSGRAVGRTFADYLSGMLCYVGYIIVAFDERKRALHDHIAGTRVVYK
jgi:uncharacterized RDD family membrane protein YckC